MSGDAEKPDDLIGNEGWCLVFYDASDPTAYLDAPSSPEDSSQGLVPPEQEDDPMFWDGRLRTQGEMIGIVYEVMRKALRYPVMAGCDLGWGGTYGKFPYDVARLIIQEGPIALEEFIHWDDETTTWYLWAIASTYVHFGPERAHSVRDRLRREAFDAIEHGIDNSVLQEDTPLAMERPVKM